MGQGQLAEEPQLLRKEPLVTAPRGCLCVSILPEEGVRETAFPGKMALRWCPGKPRPRRADRSGWECGGGDLAGAPVACCCRRGPGSSPTPPFLAGLAGWLPSQFLCSNRTRDKAHGCLSTSPWYVCGSPACLSLSLSLCVSISFSLLSESSTSFPPLSSSLSLVPG